MTDEKTALRAILKVDPYLSCFKPDLLLRLRRRNEVEKRLLNGITLSEFANGHHYFGFQKDKDGWVYREWLPEADRVWLIGDFNGWNGESHPLTRLSYGGVWERHFAPDELQHGQHVKLLVQKNGERFERIPAYIRRCEFDENLKRLCGIIWMPEEPFEWHDQKHYGAPLRTRPLIYEAHVGMAQEEQGIGTYRQFADFNLPYIASLGYNTVQLMAIAEHPYYASFGYQVSNFFAPCHRFGTPEDLKYLIDKAHSLGIRVLLDVVHAHSCQNLGESLWLQDGTPYQYFCPGDRGSHPAWGTKVFDYGRDEVLHFLLSNLKYWQEEFHFDGFRFDGVTSMVYENHGLGENFVSYDHYFSLNTNVDALTYLALANDLVHEVNPAAITVAEEMSGMPGMCLPTKKAGMGFDYRLAMGVPDVWIRLLKEHGCDEWDMGKLWYELTCRRPQEKNIGYCESHDQALVGDMTLIFRLARAEMYTGMMKDDHPFTVDIAMDMHKLIRFVTLSLAADGYLCFMGNEFGHPEWIDFPREGNGWSYLYARRQWSLMQNPDLKYRDLLAFDKAMVSFTRRGHVLGKQTRCLAVDNDRKLFAFERAGFIYVFNFHVLRAEQHFRFSGVEDGSYYTVFSSDKKEFSGQDRISFTAEHPVIGGQMEVYIPPRCAMVLAKK